MFLRFLLVGAVTCLGVDLTAWRQAASDVRAGCGWCRQQFVAAAQAVTPAPEVKVADRDDAAAETPMPAATSAFVADAAPMPIGDDAFATIAEPTPAPEPAPVVAVVDPDAGFQVVMTETVSRFTAELAGGATAPTDTALATIAEPPPLPEPAPAVEAPAEDLYPGLAYDLNRDADGLPDDLLYVPAPAIVHQPTPPDPEPTAAPEQAARLAAAVRLTGQAVHAWMSLLQAPSVALDEAAALSR